MGEVDKKLMDPAANDLIPDDGLAIEPPELAPGYEQSKSAGIDALEATLETSTLDPCGLPGDLQLRRVDAGGLRVYKGGLPVRDISGLEPFDLLAIKKYLEGTRRP